MQKRKEFIGKVVSDKMDKTVVVAIDRMVQHPRYKKYIRRTHKMKAHDEANACQMGDRVKLIETRPFSAQKRWVVLEIVKPANEAVEKGT